MPRIEQLGPAPEYVGKAQIDKDQNLLDSEGGEQISNIFSVSPNAKMGCFIINPEKVTNIPYAPIFFEKINELEGDIFLSKGTIKDPSTALETIQNKLEEVARKYWNPQFPGINTYGLVVEKSQIGTVTVKGFVQCEMGKTSTKFYVAQNSELFREQANESAR